MSKAVTQFFNAAKRAVDNNYGKLARNGRYMTIYMWKDKEQQ